MRTDISRKILLSLYYDVIRDSAAINEKIDTVKVSAISS